MARYCVAFDTMKQFSKVSGTENLSELVGVLISSLHSTNTCCICTLKHIDACSPGFLQKETVCYVVLLTEMVECLDSVGVKKQRVQQYSVEDE